jgi:hypothetical protein
VGAGVGAEAGAGVDPNADEGKKRVLLFNCPKILAPSSIANLYGTNK